MSIFIVTILRKLLTDPTSCQYCIICLCKVTYITISRYLVLECVVSCLLSAAGLTEVIDILQTPLARTMWCTPCSSSPQVVHIVCTPCTPCYSGSFTFCLTAQVQMNRSRLASFRGSLHCISLGSGILLQYSAVDIS